MKHNVLFTGGWDSTFRLCQLSFRDVEVQPVYFDGQRYNDRTNWKKEMQAQDDVLALLRQKEATKAVFHDPIRLTDKDLPKDDAFDRAFEKWSPCDLIPGQLRFLGKVAKLYPDLEYCIEGPTLKRRRQGFKKGKTHAFLEEQGFKFKFYPDGSTDVDSSKADPDLQLLWGGLTFPILGITEQDMVPYIHRWGYEDVFAKTWTCDFGGDEPCGVCHNCETKWASGLKNFFPPAAVRNHKIKEHLEKYGINQDIRDFLLIGPTSITMLFTDYVGRGYKVVNHINVLTLPQAIQPVVYEKQLEQRVRLQSFFDDLIRKWDDKNKEVV